jgi:hypothetical protein
MKAASFTTQWLTRSKPRGKSRPTQDYMDHMIRGANEHGFPKPYIDLLEKLRY